ncbi:hypothetical protein TNCV_4814451 [Trichonephila clavipes]|nr:hypothetical protein TNCV_4814451 [Trichonephila clavipes]
MCKAVILYREHKILSGFDVSEKAGKGSKTTNALDVQTSGTAENIEKFCSGTSLKHHEDYWHRTSKPSSPCHYEDCNVSRQTAVNQLLIVDTITPPL